MRFVEGVEKRRWRAERTLTFGRALIGGRAAGLGACQKKCAQESDGGCHLHEAALFIAPRWVRCAARAPDLFGGRLESRVFSIGRDQRFSRLRAMRVS
jgi:hypothetical protein